MPRNVFEDLGFSPQEAANLKIKTDLHTKIVRQAGHYTQQQLQKVLSISQPRVSDLLHGKMSKFSLEMLLIYAQKLGLHHSPGFGRICRVCQSNVLLDHLRCHSCRTDYTLQEFKRLTRTVDAGRITDVTIFPTYDRVLLEFDEPECKTAGGLFIPDRVQVESKQEQGVARFATVLAVGPGRFYRKLPNMRRPMALKPGDRVACPALNFPIKMGTKKATDWRTGITTLQDRDVFLVNEDAVLGIL